MLHNLTDPKERPEPIDPALCASVWDVVLDARSRFKEQSSADVHLPRDFEPLEFRRFENSGFPFITRGFSSDRIDYRRCFALEGLGDWGPVGELESFQRLTKVVEGHEQLRQRFLIKVIPDPSDDGRHFFDYEVWNIPATIFDRLMWTVGVDFDRDDFLAIYCRLEAGFLWDDLPFAIAVPIVLTHFEPNEFWLDDNVGLIELSEKAHLARQPSKYQFNSPASETLVAAATHALVLTGYQMENPSGFHPPPHQEPSWYPTQEIERFFNALRVVTGLESGYAQMVLYPAGDWAHRFDHDFPPVLRGPVVRRYPPHFERSGWQEERQAVTEGQLIEVKEIYGSLADSDSLDLAATRLGAAMLRDNDDDKILDLLIGLEAALGDGGSGEMTYKLAMRSAAILTDSGIAAPGVIFGAVKRLYDYRSAVAHGDRKRAAKRRVVVFNDEERNAPDLAMELLRQAIRALGRRMDLNGGGDIDSKIILSRLRDHS